MRITSLALTVVALVGCSPSDDGPSNKNDAGGVGGAGGSDGAALDAAAGDCTEVAVEGETLAPEGDWVGALSVQGTLRIGDDDLARFAVAAYRALPEPGTPPLWDSSRTWLMGIKQTGNQAFEIRPYDTFPPEITAKNTGIYSGAWSGDTLGVVQTHKTIPEFVIVKPDSPGSGITKVPLSNPPNPSSVAAPTYVTWDGEAWAVHGYGAPPQFTLWVARVGTDGTLLLPYTQFGETINAAIGTFAHVLSTDPVSGRTYVFDAYGKSNVLNGHARDGSRLPGMESGPKLIKANGTPTTSTDTPAVSADSTGVWVGWAQLNTGPAYYPMLVQRLDVAGDPVGDAIEVPGEDVLGDKDRVRYWALLSRGPSGLVAFAATAAGAYVYEVDQGQVKNLRRVVVDDSGDADLDFRALQMLEHDGELWLGFNEHSGLRRVRALKAAPGCVYHYPEFPWL